MKSKAKPSACSHCGGTAFGKIPSGADRTGWRILGFIILVPSVMGVLVCGGLFLLAMHLWDAAAQTPTDWQVDQIEKLDIEFALAERIVHEEDGREQLLHEHVPPAKHDDVQRVFDETPPLLIFALFGFVFGILGAQYSWLAGVGAIFSWVLAVCGWLLFRRRKVLACLACQTPASAS